MSTPREALPVWVKAVYGAPSFAGAAIAIPILIHMPKFYSDVVLVPVGWIAMAIAIARALDAITDPAIGWLSDRTESRLGRRRPWIALGAPICALALVALFSPPTSLSPSQAGAWFTATFALYFLFHAIYEIPYQGLGFELSPDYNDRSSLFAWRMAFIIVGTVIASIAPAVLARAGVADPRTQMQLIAIAFGSALIVLFGLLVATAHERSDAGTHTTNPLVPGVRRALRNRPFRILFLTFVIGSLPSAIPALMLPFFISYVIQPEHPEQTLGLFLLLYFGSSFLFLPFWVFLAGRIGKLNAWLASFGIGISAGIGLFFAGQGDVLYVALLHVWAGVAFGAGGLLVPSMQADVVDYDELHTGKRREAQFAAFWAIVPKFVAIPGAALPIAALATIGYVPNAVQTPQVQLGIRVIYAIVPAVFGIASYFLARLYPISEAVHAEIKTGIAAHARGEHARDPLTGESFAPPASRAIDEATGWFLDYFSPRELAKLAAGASDGLVRAVGTKLAVSAALTVWFLVVAIRGLEITVGPLVVAIGGIDSLDTDPGLAPVMCVVGGGFALTAACFHALRLRRAREMQAAPIAPKTVQMHLDGITSAEARLDRAA